MFTRELQWVRVRRATAALHVRSLLRRPSTATENGTTTQSPLRVSKAKGAGMDETEQGHDVTRR